MTASLRSACMERLSFKYMRKKFFLSLFFFVAAFIHSQAQNKYTISGYVKDAKTGEELIGASVIIKEMKATGATANAYGFYSITIPEGNYTVTSQFIGYGLKSVQVELKQN